MYSNINCHVILLYTCNMRQFIHDSILLLNECMFMLITILVCYDNHYYYHYHVYSPPPPIAVVKSVEINGLGLKMGDAVGKTMMMMMIMMMMMMMMMIRINDDDDDDDDNHDGDDGNVDDDNDVYSDVFEWCDSYF